MNVANAEQTRSVIEKVGSEYGTIDILVNNAGVFATKPFSELSPEDFDWMMNVNFKGAFSPHYMLSLISQMAVVSSLLEAL